MKKRVLCAVLALFVLLQCAVIVSAEPSSKNWGNLDVNVDVKLNGSNSTEITLTSKSTATVRATAELAIIDVVNKCRELSDYGIALGVPAAEVGEAPIVGEFVVSFPEYPAAITPISDANVALYDTTGIFDLVSVNSAESKITFSAETTIAEMLTVTSNPKIIIEGIEVPEGTFTLNGVLEGKSTCAIRGVNNIVTYSAIGDTTAKVTVKKGGSPSGGPAVAKGEEVNEPKEYKISAPSNIINGSAISSRDTAPKGADVSITAAPDEGYAVDTIVVRDASGNELEVKAVGSNNFTFEMPEGDVSFEIKFKVAPKPVVPVVPVDPSVTGVDELLETDSHILYLIGYPEGDFRPHGNMTRAECAMMFYRLLKNQNVGATHTFSDVDDNAWYGVAVNTLAKLGIICGRNNGLYDPDTYISRADFTAVAVRFATITKNGTMAFDDVASTHYAAQAISDAVEFGWISGIGNNKFAPDAPIERCEVSKIVNNMLGRKADMSYVNTHPDNIIFFPDVTPADWFYENVIESTNAHNFDKTTGTEKWF